MSRVASEASNVASQHHAARNRAPSTAPTPQPFSPFSDLLENTAPPPARDAADAPPKPVKRSSSSSEGETRPGKSREHSSRNASDRTERAASEQQRPSAADTKPEADAKPAPDAEGAESGEEPSEATTAQAEADLLAVTIAELPAEQVVAAAQVPVTPLADDLAVAATVPGVAVEGAETGGVAAAETGVAAAVGVGGVTETDGATGGKAELAFDAKRAGQTQPHAKIDAATLSQEAAGQAQAEEGSQTGGNAEAKPEAHRHAQPGTGEAVAQKHGEPSPQPQIDANTPATVDGAKPAADGALPPAQAAHTNVHASNATLNAPLAHTASDAADDAAVPVAGLGVEIAARAQSGRNRFEIRLDPPELGRIDVRLDVDRSGQVTSRLLVDRVETLDMLRRDASDLERALQQAGLKTADNGLQFALRDQSFAGRDQGQSEHAMARVIVPDSELGPVETLASGYGRLLRSGGGVDIRI